MGSKERLIGEVLWSFAEEGLAQARALASGSGAEYIVDVFERFDRPVLRSEQPQRELGVLLEEPAQRPEFRVQAVQQRMIAAARALLAEQVRAGALTPALDIDTLAYLMVRVAESFIYSDVITGSEPDVDKAVEVVRVLLHAPPLHDH